MRYVAPIAALLLAFLPLRAPASTISATQGASTYEASSALAPAVRNLQPAPGGTLKAFFPQFSATLQPHGAPLRPHSLHLYVDGTDVSAAAQVNGNTVSYVPREHLQAGWHDVFLEGSDTANDTFSEAWVFRSQNPDIDLPMAGNGGLAFVPVGHHGRFAHFFLVSPFDGFGLLQLCGFEVPLHHANGTPVFFVTVPITLGTALLGCTPGLAFTPFQAGIGALNPIFFPIEIAGPGIFHDGGDQHRRHPLVGGMPAIPVYRPMATMPVYRTTTGMPILGSPVRASAPIPAAAAMPKASIPQPYIPQPSIPY